MAEEKRGGSLGRLPLPRDDRDFPMRALLAEVEIPTTLTRKFWYRPLVLDQDVNPVNGSWDPTGTCEGNMGTSWLIDGPVTHPDIEALQSASSAEAYARQLYVDATGDTSLQQGAYTRQILKVLTDRGLIGAYHAAANVDEVVNALKMLGPVMFASDWFRSQDQPVYKYENAYIYVDEASGWRGGHAYLLDGVNTAPSAGEPYVRMKNSWGTGWAHLGTARITLDDLAKLFVGDAWIGTELRR